MTPPPFMTLGKLKPQRAATAEIKGIFAQDLQTVIAAVHSGEREKALRLALAAARQGLEHPLVLVLAAEELDETGDFDGALALLSKATSVAAGEPEPWRRRGELLARLDRADEAAAAFEAALQADPDSVPALVGAGGVQYRLGDLAAAQKSYDQAVRLDAASVEALSGLALVAARQRRPDAARAFARRALLVRPDHFGATLALARAELIDGATQSAESRLSGLLQMEAVPDQIRVAALDLRAEVRDALDQSGEAFGDYEARNLILEKLNAPRIKADVSERRVDQARRLAAYYRSNSRAAWSVTSGDLDTISPVKGHVFLAGFPRSGTTLLEKVLASHGEVLTLEEVDHLGRAGGHLLESEAGLQTLARLSLEGADACRAIYWRGITETLGNDIAEKTVVDKLPLHTVALPLIAKLFPEAKILFALRDPRDVVLSCFRRRFRLNSAMYEFLRLDRASNYYHAVMTLADIYRSELPLTILEVRHEHMVERFDDEVRRVLAFINLDWDDAVKNFAAHAESPARTPSDLQLSGGLNSDGVGQWRRYANQIRSILPTLDLWAQRYGYETAS